MKALRPPISEKKNFEDLLLCSNLCPHIPNGVSFDPGDGGHPMNKLGRGPQEDAIYQI